MIFEKIIISTHKEVFKDVFSSLIKRLKKLFFFIFIFPANIIAKFYLSLFTQFYYLPYIVFIVIVYHCFIFMN